MSSDIHRYQSLLNEIESSTPDAVKRNSGHARGNSIISAEDTGSLSRSNSDESNIHNNSGTNPHQLLHGQPQPQHHPNSKARRSRPSTGGSVTPGSGGRPHTMHHATSSIATNGHTANGAAGGGLTRNRSSSSSSANSSNPATPLTPNMPHTPLSPLNSLGNLATKSVSHSLNTPTSPGSAQSVPHALSTTDSHSGLSSAGAPVLCHAGGLGPLSPSNLTGGHNIPPIEEEGTGRERGSAKGNTGCTKGLLYRHARAPEDEEQMSEGEVFLRAKAGHTAEIELCIVSPLAASLGC